MAVAIALPALCFSQTAGGQESSTDYTEIKQTIKDGVTNWLQKGEFEKSDAHAARLKSGFPQAFDSICFEAVRSAIRESSRLQFELLKYNADTEKFGVRFYVGEISWADTQPVAFQIQKQ